MEVTGNDLAGVVDLFGGLTRSELGEALAEIAFKRGEESATDAYDRTIERAVRSYHLVSLPQETTTVAVDEAVLTAGPAAFPALPEGATDLPHILDIETREVDREATARAAEQQFREDASTAVETGDTDRIETLIDVSYELEAWGDIDLARSRQRLDAALS